MQLPCLDFELRGLRGAGSGPCYLGWALVLTWDNFANLDFNCKDSTHQFDCETYIRIFCTKAFLRKCVIEDALSDLLSGARIMNLISRQL